MGMGNLVNFITDVIAGIGTTDGKSVEQARRLKKLSCLWLVRKTYRRSGYSFSFFCLIKNLLDRKKITMFYIRSGRRVSSTLSVVCDSSKGLPLDSIYKEEANILRTEGKKIAEVGKFASSAGASGVISEVWELMSEVRKHATDNQIDYLCITVNPRHRNIYRRIGFSPLGEIKTHPGVNAPAVFMTVGVKEWLKERATGI